MFCIKLIVAAIVAISLLWAFGGGYVKMIGQMRLSSPKTAGFILRSFSCNRNLRSSLSEEKKVEVNWQRRCELATAYRAFAMYNMNEGVCNHLTAKSPSLHQKDDIMLITPYGIYWSEVTPQSLVGIHQETGKMVEGTDLPDVTALSIHRGIYRHRPDVQSVMHSHARYATVLSTLEDAELKMVHQNSCRFVDSIAYDKDYGGFPNDDLNDESDVLGKSIGDKNVLLMSGHGFVTTGPSVHWAFDLHYYFEKAAEVQVLGYMTGKPTRTISRKVALQLKADLTSTKFDYWARSHFNAIQEVLKREDPTFLKPTQ